ncbi:hypothetical protein GGX14DRAFT_398877 [Mycena pura]|uniref:Uncharacterized protein n=1 Tax=Mycena pura TaxID=153505 RepID=A0AAD6Y7B7_9AGAR|nr:hypothetical protein GGX14DRAFT_398877 [Mycena pura]
MAEYTKILVITGLITYLAEPCRALPTDRIPKWGPHMHAEAQARPADGLGLPTPELGYLPKQQVAELTDAVLQLAAVELKETWKSAQTFKLENHTRIDTPCSGLQTSVSVMSVETSMGQRNVSLDSCRNEPFQESEEVSNPKRNYPNFRGGGWFMK